MCYRKGYGKGYRRSYSLICNDRRIVCLETGLNGFHFSRGSGYLFMGCCRVVTVSCFSACIGQWGG